MIMKAIDWIFLLEPVWGISSLPNIFCGVPFIHTSCLFVQYSLPKNIKQNVFWIPFYDQYSMDFVPLFSHVCSTMWFYSIILVWLKWVGSDILLESISMFDGLYLWYLMYVSTKSGHTLMLLIIHLWKLWCYSS